MTYPELLDAITDRGIKLELRLGVGSPRGAITPEIRAALTECKPHLLAKLGRDALWDVLSKQRWGPTLKPHADDGPDSYAQVERVAIQAEANPVPGHRTCRAADDLPSAGQINWLRQRLVYGPVGAIAATWQAEIHCGRMVNFDTDQDQANFVVRALVWKRVLLDRLGGSVQQLHSEGAWYFRLPHGPWPPQQVDIDVAEGHANLLPQVNLAIGASVRHPDCPQSISRIQPSLAVTTLRVPATNSAG